MLEGKHKPFYCRLSFHTNTNDGHYDCNGVFLFLKWYFVFSPDTLDANLKYMLPKHLTFYTYIINITTFSLKKTLD